MFGSKSETKKYQLFVIKLLINVYSYIIIIPFLFIAEPKRKSQKHHRILADSLINNIAHLNRDRHKSMTTPEKKSIDYNVEKEKHIICQRGTVNLRL